MRKKRVKETGKRTEGYGIEIKYLLNTLNKIKNPKIKFKFSKDGCSLFPLEEDKFSVKIVLKDGQKNTYPQYENPKIRSKLRSQSKIVTLLKNIKSTNQSTKFVMPEKNKFSTLEKSEFTTDNPYKFSF